MDNNRTFKPVTKKSSVTHCCRRQKIGKHSLQTKTGNTIYTINIYELMSCQIQDTLVGYNLVLSIHRPLLFLHRQFFLKQNYCSTAVKIEKITYSFRRFSGNKQYLRTVQTPSKTEKCLFLVEINSYVIVSFHAASDKSKEVFHEIKQKIRCMFCI